MDIVIIILLVILIILAVASLMKNVNEAHITDRLGQLEVSYLAPTCMFCISFSNEREQEMSLVVWW